MASEDIPLVVVPIPNGFKLTFRGPIQAQREFLDAEMDRVVKLKPSVVQLDLVGIEYLASEGLGILVGFRNKVVANGAKLTTVSVHPRVLGVLKLSGLLPILNVQVPPA